ncbi:suppressor of fused domain protein [Salipaludibacillus sp. LMS25]|jgi:hypothetical protein|uniref:suppressor of fused domain protein n=1 Tax=Salipaludibacillus sp. LMS25 TaxID=2924031 RepID=UPI0020D0E97B|nr:suppressor of fused domain protein [Salipaludibacillus sp. LMS25]UTR15002.1 suppressor of fused domain protein [Salipaludibacillus sp. LMS25]
MTVSNQNKLIVKTALQSFGGTPKVNNYWDDNKDQSIDILSTLDRPYKGVSSYSTIGLSDWHIGYSVKEKQLRTEILGASATEFDSYPTILATCAFFVINSKFSLSHGHVFEKIIKFYYPESEMKHILFTSPFLWDNLHNLDFSDKVVTWLMAVPISENEYLLKQEKGLEALESLFEQEDIDIFNIYRNSVL